MSTAVSPPDRLVARCAHCGSATLHHVGEHPCSGRAILICSRCWSYRF